MKYASFITLFLLSLSVSVSANNTPNIVWHWQSEFTQSEQNKFKQWIETVHQAVTRRYGAFPFAVHIHFHKARWPNEPVPWANTDRKPYQAIHFHVDENASMGALLADWTAPHEISHLLLPYLGRSKSWFAEGFASYMQYKIMTDLNELSEQQKWRKYQSRMQRAENRYLHDDIPFAIAGPQLAADRQYPTMYWGGATYFINIEHQLKQDGIDIDQVLAHYLSCCRMKTRNIESLLSYLDAISKTTHFQDQYNRFEKRAGFPDFKPALRSLSQKSRAP